MDRVGILRIRISVKGKWKSIIGEFPPGDSKTNMMATNTQKKIAPQV